MPTDDLTIEVAAHPLLRPVAFTTRLPKPLGEISSPEWVMDLLALEAEAPVRRTEGLRLAVRDMLRHWGHKPAGRGKPAAEYLTRAVGQGALGSINVAVDICNVVSLHAGLSIALVDLDLARPPFRVDRGSEGERYVFNASGQEMELEGLICLFAGMHVCVVPQIVNAGMHVCVVPQIVNAGMHVCVVPQIVNAGGRLGVVPGPAGAGERGDRPGRGPSG
jgi:hypothetical protein